jgi:hypothetical protein
MSSLTLTLTNNKELIPTELAAALKSLVSVAAISTIDTGDRSLNAAIGGIITICFAIGIDRLQKFPSWESVGTYVFSQFRCFGSVSGSVSGSSVCVARCSRTKQQKLTISPTGFDPRLVPIPPETYIFKYGVVFEDNYKLLDWASSKFDSRYIANESKFTTIGFTKISTISYKTGVSVDSMDLIYKPVWWCETTNKFVYIKKINSGAIRLYCDEEQPLQDCIESIKEYHLQIIQLQQKTVPTFAIFSINKTLAPFMVGQISSSKTFDGLFFEQKQELLELLTRFRDNTMYASHLGEDNKLGILLYGPPGTGKTACVSAIANFIKYNVIQVSGSQMRNKKIMDDLFSRRREIVFFDEFDCLMDVIQKREQQPDPSPAGKYNRSGSGFGFGVGSMGGDTMSLKHAHTMKLLELANNEKDDAKKKELMKAYDEAIEEQENKIDIGYLLTKFQGLASVDGRCIIATTNCPDKIDSALKRKGRFDIILRLGNATPKMIRDILMYYFQITDEQEREAITRDYSDSMLPNEVYSPAEIQDFASRSSSIREAFEKIIQ